MIVDLLGDQRCEKKGIWYIYRERNLEREGMEFDEDQEEEMAISVPASYESPENSKMAISVGVEMDGALSRKGVRYRECLKNHAVRIGGHAVDGCGEFIAAGEEGTLDALKCAACNCHRNFHRKEIEGGESFHHHHNSPFSPNNYYRAAAHPHPGFLHMPPPPVGLRHLALPPTFSDEQEDASNPSSSGSKKRFRTKFTPEQKEKMLDFAERLGWKIQKQDEAAVQQFCVENCVKRHVLKVWMHNNKHTLGKKP